MVNNSLIQPVKPGPVLKTTIFSENHWSNHRPLDAGASHSDRKALARHDVLVGDSTRLVLIVIMLFVLGLPRDPYPSSGYTPIGGWGNPASR